MSRTDRASRLILRPARADLSGARRPRHGEGTIPGELASTAPWPYRAIWRLPNARILDRAKPARQPVRIPRPNFRTERALFRDGYLRVAGVDEAGRGPLAGPVVAAAVVLNPKRIPKGIADSKLLTRGSARSDLRGALRDGGDLLRLRLRDRDRPHQHPAGDACRHAPRGVRPRRARRRRADRRQRAAARTALRGARHHRRRRAASRSPPPRSSRR